MAVPLRVLLVEDLEDDALLILHELRQGNYDPIYRRVDTEEAMAEALDRESWDIILADYAMPGFSGLEAIKLVKERELDIPFIIISGTIGEDIAVLAMKAGAHDYLLKDHLARLVPAVERELREAGSRKARRQAEFRIKTFLDLGQELDPAMTQKEAARIIVNKADQLFGWDACLVDLYDPASKIFRPILYMDTVNGEKTEYSPPASGQTQSPLVQRTVEKGAQLLLREEDHSDDTNLLPFGDTSRLSASLMYVPIRKGDNKIGVLSIQSYTPHTYTQEDLQILQSLADYCGSALERIRTQEALRESERMLATLMSNLPGMAYRCRNDQNWTMYFVSEGCFALTGYHPSDIIMNEKISFSEIIHPGDQTNVWNTIQAALKIDQPYELEYRIICANEEIKWVWERGRGIRSSEDDTLYLEGFINEITQRKRAQEELRQAHDVYRRTIEHAQGVPYRLDFRKFKYDFVGEGCKDLLGIAAEDLKYETLKSLVRETIISDPEAPPTLAEYAQKFLRRESDKYQVDLRMLLLTGEEKWISDYSLPIIDEKTGEVIASMGILQDITSRKHTEHRVAIYASLGVRLSEGTSSIQAARIIAETSDQLLGWDSYSLTFYDHESRLIQPILNIDLIDGKRRDVPPAYEYEECSPMLRKVLNEGPQLLLREQEEGEDILVPFGDTARRSASLMFVAIHHENQVIGFLSIQSYQPYAYSQGDLRELQLLAEHCSGALVRTQAEEAHKRLATAVEQAAEIVLITDPRGLIQYVNPAFEQITKYARKEVIGKNPRILKSGKHDDVFYQNLWDTITRGDVWRGHLINRKKTGKLYQEEATISPVYDSSGTIVNYVAVKRDITSEIMMEEQLRQAQKMEAVGLLAGGVAHDFNNILQAILGYSGLALQGLSPHEDRYDELVEIQKSAERAAELTRQLLAFSRRQVLKPKDIDLNDLITNLLKMLRRLIGEDIDLEFTLGHRLGTIYADPGQIEQVLINLCINARDAMPDGGKITIETETVLINNEYCETHPWAIQGRYVLLSVTDTGCGMDKETRERIFEPFYTSKEVGKGTGLGLSTVYGIVKQHDGMIQVYSEVEKGTLFKVYLPLVERPAVKVGKEIPGPVRGGTETILMGEDDPAVRKMVVRLLQNRGYQVLAAKDGLEALNLFQAHINEIAMVLLDVVMPRLGGREVYEKIVTIKPGVPVLFSSGYSANAIHTRFVLDEGMQLIPKPYDPDMLLRKIRDLLDHKTSSESVDE